MLLCRRLVDVEWQLVLDHSGSFLISFLQQMFFSFSFCFFDPKETHWVE